MKTVIQIAKDLGVTTEVVKNTLKNLGHLVRSPSSKFDLLVEKAVKENVLVKGIKFNEEKTRRVNVKSIHSIPKEFYASNPFEATFHNIITTQNYFKNRVANTVIQDGVEIQTIFSHTEAFTICAGLEDRNVKKMAREYFDSKHLTGEQVRFGHLSAMAAFEKYGGSLISYVMSLEPLPFKAADATQIFSELDKRRHKQDFPLLRILFINERHERETLQVTYFSEKVGNERQRYSNVIQVKNLSTGAKLMRVTRDGIVMSERNAKNTIPVLQLFIKFSSNPKKAILHYGLATGECSICGRPLKDTESVRIGVGPICRQYLK